MIFEMRTYRLQPGSVPEAEKRFGEALTERVKVSPLGAFFIPKSGRSTTSSTSGPMTTCSIAPGCGRNRSRTGRRRSRNSSSRWRARSSMRRRSARPSRRASMAISTRSGPIRCCPESPSRSSSAGPSGSRAGQAVAARTAGHTELGPLNQWIHIWAYKDANERARIREESRKDGSWPPATRGMFVKQENMLVVPASFSPLR